MADNTENTELVQKFQAAIPSTREELGVLAFDLLDQVETGAKDPLELLRNFKMLEKLSEMLKDRLMELVVAEADKYPGKEFERYGVKFEKVETAVKFDYSVCNDAQYNSILSTEEKLKKEKSTREAFLKSINGSFDDVDTNTGEVLKTIYAPVRTSKSIVKVTIK